MPEHQLFFYCTDRLGKLAYTATATTAPVTEGYSREVDDIQCSVVGVKVWKLSPIKPTNAEAGLHSLSAVDSDCETLPRRASFIESVGFQLYTVTER